MFVNYTWEPSNMIENVASKGFGRRVKAKLLNFPYIFDFNKSLFRNHKREG